MNKFVAHLLKLAESAKGIPDRGHYTEITKGIQSGDIVDYVRNRHQAFRRGCFPGGTRIRTDQGWLRINDIVKHKLACNALSYNEVENKLEYKPIVNWFKNGSTTQWLRLCLSPRSNITVTENHLVYVYQQDKLVKKTVGELCVNDCLTQFDTQLNEDQFQFLLGSLLGDGHIKYRHQLKPVFEWGQAVSHKEYVDFVSSLFGITKLKLRKAVKNKTDFYSITYSHAVFNSLASVFYTKHKIVPIDLLYNKMDARALAVWFMDDGQWSPSTTVAKKRKPAVNNLAGQVYLYTNGFSENENKQLQRLLKEKFGVSFNIRERDGYFYLCASGIENNTKFFNLVSPYIVPNMQYKSPVPTGSYTWTTGKTEQIQSYPALIKRIEKITSVQPGVNGKVYPAKLSKFDIEVQDNHNYFTSNCLVSNSHFDIRFGKNKQTGLHSWATSFDYPEPGGKINVIQCPTHSYDYLGWEGDIPRGQYGGGNVTVADKGKILITDIKPDEVHFTIASDKSQKRFAMIKGPDRHWVMVRAAHPKEHETEKPKLKSVPREEIADYLKGLSDTAVAQPKIDGALNFLRLKSKPDLLSHRNSKVTGTPIIHSERFFGGRPKLDLPPEWKNTVLMTEVFGERKGKVIPPQELGGILNSTIANSLQKQKDDDIKLKAMVFDIARKGNETIDRAKIPYEERRKLIEQVMKYLPTDKFVLPEQVTGATAIKALAHKIQHGKHSLTGEGLVVHEKDKPVTKVKFTDEHDVYIRDFFPGEGKYRGKGVGGFKYSLEPKGPIVGRVGGGLSDDLRVDMFKNQDEYMGRIARVRSLGQFPKSQALRGASLLALHEG